MNLDMGLNLSQEQKLIMTQQMQLSVKLLQMSTIDLQTYVENELENNPLLELKKEYKITNNENDNIENGIKYKEFLKYLDFDKYGDKCFSSDSIGRENTDVSPFNFICTKKTLKDFLYEQVFEINETEFIKNICKYIIENLDERGYLDLSIIEIAQDLKIGEKQVYEALDVVQSLEPSGIGARDIKECLKLQLKRKDIKDPNLFIIIDDYLQMLGENKYNAISEKLNISPQKVQEYFDLIKKLEPKPSRGYFTGEETRYIIPDAYIREINNELIIIMNDSAVPKLTISTVYKNILNSQQDKEIVNYVKDKMDSAVFLIKSINNRENTLNMILKIILEIQKDYFIKGEKYLVPMTLKDIAEKLNMHESTISRAIKDKYISTNKGISRIKDLFTTGMSYNNNDSAEISASVVKNSIKDLINNEDKKNPLSDSTITEMLNKMGINIARRTVAKYREEIGIQPSKIRKRI